MTKEEIKKIVDLLNPALFVLVNSKNQKVGDADVMEALETVGMVRNALDCLTTDDRHDLFHPILEQAKNLIRNNNVLKKFEHSFDCPKFKD